MYYFNLYFRSAASCNTSDHAATHQHTAESCIMSNDMMYEKIDKQICFIQSVTLRGTKYNYKNIISSPFICAEAYDWSLLRKTFALTQERYLRPVALKKWIKRTFPAYHFAFLSVWCKLRVIFTDFSDISIGDHSHNVFSFFSLIKPCCDNWY